MWCLDYRKPQPSASKELFSLKMTIKRYLLYDSAVIIYFFRSVYMPLVKCANCGREVEPQKPSFGCFWAILWFAIGILPGIIYIIYNRSKPAVICPACGINAYKPTRVPAVYQKVLDTLRCSKCGSNISSTDKYCKNCGALVEKKSRAKTSRVTFPFDCPYCGNSITSATEQCPNCLNDLWIPK
jgi:primosomal protein N'